MSNSRKARDNGYIIDTNPSVACCNKKTHDANSKQLATSRKVSLIRSNFANPDFEDSNKKVEKN